MLAKYVYIYTSMAKVLFVYALKSFSGSSLPEEAIASPVPLPASTWMAQLLPAGRSGLRVRAPSFAKDKTLPVTVRCL